MDGRSRMPPAQALAAMSMDDLIVSFNASLGAGSGRTASFWAQQIMHRQQIDIAGRMEQATNRVEEYTRMILVLTVLMAVTATVNLWIVAWATR
ncbi:MAG: hypothetical protein OXI46_03370 [Gemmatimonadota bacterium]|nr:hypothetical protein [Gemmatimonadota bacterium]